MAVAIVLIPQENTRVWKISSEKVPHVTLLYLGDPGWDASQLRNVLDFVGHTASLTRKLWLFPEDRDTLGPDEADVVLFSKRDNEQLVNLRHNLLGNDTIRVAHEAENKFPVWVPHLTLGYPESPAREVDGESTLWGIEFDRLAVWTGDYEGVDYKLLIDDDDGQVAMSGAAVTEGILEHYGVKGMKWGVRRADKSSGGGGGASGRPANKPDTARTQYSKAPKNLSTAELKRRIQRMEMERQYNRLNRTDVSEGQQIARELLINTGRRLAKGVLNVEADGAIAAYMSRRR